MKSVTRWLLVVLLSAAILHMNVLPVFAAALRVPPNAAIATRAPHAASLPVSSTTYDPSLPRVENPAENREDSEPTPENTVVLANASDASFFHDFSYLLRNLACEWIILDADEIPASVRDKNLILVGRLEAEHSGDVIQQLITSEEEESILGDAEHAVLYKEHPGNAARMLIIASGTDTLGSMQSAEEVVASLIKQATGPSAWLSLTPEVPFEQLRSAVSEWQHKSSDDELPTELLWLDLEAAPPRQISSSNASLDVDYLFYLLESGYCGYGYFQALDDFDDARDNIQDALGEQQLWSPDALATLIYQHLDFVHDCHLKLGNQVFCRHLDFWYDAEHELWKSKGKFQFVAERRVYTVVSINGADPDKYILPSLNAEGLPIYRIGMLSATPPGPLTLAGVFGDEQHTLTINLRRSEYYPGEPFGEDRIGGIPVLRARSFADYYAQELEDFIQAALEYHEEPYLIVDLRGNSGGNTDWPKRWIAMFTGRQPSLKQALTELESRTSMMGRAHLFQQMLDTYPADDAPWIQREIDLYTGRAKAFEQPAAMPRWTPLVFPNTRPIANRTTLIVIIDGEVSSAGEGFISYLAQQVENVVFVGENSGGALTFGQISLHQLPHSKLQVYLPIKLNIPLDLDFKEERGFYPDLWVPADQALNAAVAAARRGTLATLIDLPDGYFDAEFVPEKTGRYLLLFGPRDLVASSIILLVGIAVALANRRRGSLIFLLAGICAPAGAVFLWMGEGVGLGLTVLGAIYLSVGVIKWWKGWKTGSEG